MVFKAFNKKSLNVIFKQEKADIIVNYDNNILSPVLFSRLIAIVLLYASIVLFNAFYIQFIGSGLGIYSGLFHITNISMFIEIFLLFISSLILFGWPIISNAQIDIIKYYNYGHVNKVIEKVKSLDFYNSFNISNIPFKDKEFQIDYSIIILFSVLGSSLLISCSDLISFYLSLELQSFGLYLLSTLDKRSESSTSAGLKYFLLGGLSSCVILFGAGLIYSYSGLTNFELLYSLMSSLVTSDVELLSSPVMTGISLGIVLIFIGLLFKIAAAPLHNWSPDVYNDTPTIVTTWLTIIPKLSIVILLFELYYHLGDYSIISSQFIESENNLQTELDINNNSLNIDSQKQNEYNSLLQKINIFSDKQTYLLNEISSDQNENISSNVYSDVNNINTVYQTEGVNNDKNSLTVSEVEITSITPIKTLLLVSSLLSLIIGTVVGVTQIYIKRLLAYSTISHIGFLLLVLGINSQQSIDSLLFYIVQYSLTNLNIFLLIIGFSYVWHNKMRFNLTSSKVQNNLISNNDVSLNNISLQQKQSNELVVSDSNTDKNKEVLNINNNSIKSILLNIPDIRYISEFKNKFTLNPMLSLSLAICLFSMAGIPPLVGFFAKQFTLLSALQNGYNFLTLIAIIVSVISASYYLKVVKLMFTDESESDNNLNLKENIVFPGWNNPNKESFSFVGTHKEIEKNKINKNSQITDKDEKDTNLILRRTSSKYYKELGENVENLNISTETLTDKNNKHKESINNIYKALWNDPYKVSLNKSIPNYIKVLFILNFDISLSNLHSLIISVISLFIVLFMIKPAIILSSTSVLSVLSFFSVYE